LLEELPKYVQSWLWKNAFKYPNVVGFSLDVLPRQRNNSYSSQEAVRFYVKEKVGLDTLRFKDIIPPELSIRSMFKRHFLETDIIEIGLPEKFTIDKTKAFRPVELGVSIGNQAITAGSLGMLYLKGDDFSPWGGSNAHVLTPNAGWSVEEVINSGYVNILQPGSYHGGTLKDAVGYYNWHQQIYPINVPSNCDIAGGLAGLLNRLSRILGRQSRFKAVVPYTNSIDFGLYKITKEHILKVADESIDVEDKEFTSHLYAGSETVGILCKVSKILETRPDIKPANGYWSDPEVGDKIKGCSFWCNYETDVTDVNGVINVNYGDFMALMTDAVVVNNDGTIKGGWSGSGWFKE